MPVGAGAVFIDRSFVQDFMVALVGETHTGVVFTVQVLAGVIHIGAATMAALDIGVILTGAAATTVVFMGVLILV